MSAKGNESHQVFTHGLILNQAKQTQKKDSYSYALNAIKNDPIINGSTLENENGSQDITLTGLPSPCLLVGNIWLGVHQYVFFVKNLDTNSSVFNSIYLIDLDASTATLVYSTPLLNFQSTNEITGTYKFNYLNQRIIYWVDGLNNDSSLNIDYALSQIALGVSQPCVPIEQLSLSPSYSPAIISSIQVSDIGGNLTSGTYEFAIQYRFQNYSTTNIFGLCKPVYINKDLLNSTNQGNFGLFDGDISGTTLTSKTITLNLRDLDLNYPQFDLVVVKTINQVSSVASIQSIPITGNTMSYTYTGYENTVANNQGISAVTVDPSIYYGSEVIAQKENRLLIANTKQDKTVLRYQQYANNIVVTYTVVPKVVQANVPSVLNNQLTDYQYVSFDPSVSEYTLNVMRGEVYSLGIAFVLNSGLETQVYHIPGRSYIASDVNTNYDSSTNTNTFNWQNRDTFYTDGNGNRLNYWESTIQYPSGFDYPTSGSYGPSGNIPNLIRHHRIPSSTSLPIITYSGNVMYANYIALTFSNIQLPSAIANQVKLIKFYMTPRDLPQNKSVIAKGAFSRTAFCGGDVQYTSNSTTNGPTQLPRYVVPASPFSTIPQDVNPGFSSTASGPQFTNNASAVQQNIAQYSNTKINLFYYGGSQGNTQQISDPSDLSLPSPNTQQLNGATYQNENKTILFFHSPDTDAKADNNDKPVLSVNKALLENRLQGNVNWYKNPTAFSINSNNYNANTYNTYNQGAANGVQVPHFMGDCVFNNMDSRSGVTKFYYGVQGATYVPYNAILSQSNVGNISMPYYGILRESGTLVELLHSVSPDFSDYGSENSTTFITNAVSGGNFAHPVYDKYDGDSPTSSQQGISPYGPRGTINQLAQFQSSAPTGITGYSQNNAIYYYGSLQSANVSQYGSTLGLQYEYLGLTCDNLSVNGSGYLTTSPSGIIGDTFIDMYSIKRTAYSNYYHDATSTAGSIFQVYMAGISSFPCESSLNYRMRLTQGINGASYYPKDVYGSQADTWIQNNFAYDNYLKINDDYNKKYSKQNFGPTQINTITSNQALVTTSTLQYLTRISYSQQSLSEDTVDYWRTFLANDYRDLPKNRGPITGLFTKYERIFALTRDSLFDVYGSNYNLQNSTTTDIAVGTGTFFGLEPKEVLSIDGGYSGTSSKWSIVETPYGYLFVDKNKKSVILFNDQLKDITYQGAKEFFQLNGAISLYNQIPDLKKGSGFDNPLNNVGYTCGWDKEHNRLLVTKLDYNLVDITRYKGIYNPNTTYGSTDIYTQNGKLTNSANSLSFSDTSTFINKSFTLSYIPQLEQWASFHSYLPNNYLHHPTNFLLKQNTSSVQISNSGVPGYYFNTQYPFIIEIVANDYPQDVKVTDSIQVSLESYTGSGVDKLRGNSFFDQFMVYNEFQNSGIISLIVNTNLTKKEKIWSINQFLDVTNSNQSAQMFTDNWSIIQSVYPIDKVINTSILNTNKPWYQRGRFRDNYFVIRFSKNNLDNSKFLINFVSTQFRKSIR